jgi:hypothetical protein
VSSRHITIPVKSLPLGIKRIKRLSSGENSGHAGSNRSFALYKFTFTGYQGYHTYGNTRHIGDGIEESRFARERNARSLARSRFWPIIEMGRMAKKRSIASINGSI